MPIIRYRVGDFVTRTLLPCSCERGLSRFLRFDGRESARIYLPNGRTAWAGKVADFVEGITMTAHYRIRQIGYTQFVFECTKKMNLTTEQATKIREMLSECAGQNVQMVVKVVDFIEPLPSGKRNWFLKEFVEN